MKFKTAIPPSMKIARELMCDVFIKCPLCSDNVGRWRGDLIAHLMAIHNLSVFEASNKSHKCGVVCPLCKIESFEWRGQVILHIVDMHTRAEAIEYLLVKIKANPEEYLDPLER